MNNDKGFATLVAILMTSVMLAIGIAIINITVKEILLASSTRESARAFYAADSGIECALYWDAMGIFATSTHSPTGQSIECGEDDVEVDVPPSQASNNEAMNLFEIEMEDHDLCFSVSVHKDVSLPQTVIESRGYNTCDSSHPRRVERGIRARFDSI